MAGIGRAIENGLLGLFGVDDISAYQNSRPKELGYIGEYNGQADALRHILGSAALTQKFGPTLANIYTTAHEWIAPDLNDAASAMDVNNNAIGRELAQKYKTREEIEKAAVELMRQANESGQWNQSVSGVPRWLHNRK